MDSTIFASAREVEQFGGPVVRLYQTAFGRPPDPAGLREHVAALRRGESLTDMADRMNVSPEFLGRHGSGGPDLATIRRLYDAATGRAPDDSEIVAPLALAASGATRGAVLLAIAQGPAARAAVSLLRAIGPARARPMDEDAYQLWLAEYPDLTEADHAAVAAAIARMAAPPAMTLLMAAPSYRSDLALETIASVGRQLYPHVELRVALPADASRMTREAMTRAARETPGLVLVEGADADAALAGANGRFAGVLEAGDQLAPAALYLLADAAVRRPEAVVLYGDEDCIDGNNRRYAPRFKTGWNPDLLRAGDAIGQLAMFQVDRWRALGGLRAEQAPFQRLDLLLRVLADGAVAAHVPWVLFHRGRGGRRRPADFPEACATSLQPRLLEVERAHLPPGQTLDEAIVAGRLWPRLTVALPHPAPLVSVIVPTRDRAELLETVTAGLLGRTDYPAIELLVVDNGSTEPAALQLLTRLARDPRVRVLPSPGPFNYSAMNNMAAREARGDVLLLLNNDIEVTDPGWLREMASHAMRPDVGVVGAKLLYPDGRIQHAGMMLGPDGEARHVGRWVGPEKSLYLGQLAMTRDMGAVTGACLAIRRAVFEEVGGLEQEHLRVTWNDVDLCLRVRRAGYRVVWTPHAVLTHVELATRGHEDASPAALARFDAERDRVLSVWGAAFDDDPFHNPNLSVEDDLLLATPPRRPKPWL